MGGGMDEFRIGQAGAATIVSIHIGPVAALGPDRVASAIVKSAIPGPVAIHAAGLAGDAQADLSVHGGVDKAVYGYPADHYPAWRADFPQHGDLFVPGGMGENLAIAGLDEDRVHLGDVWAIGSARLQISQPRQPCFKLALRFGDKMMPKAMIRSGRSGWYFRVIEPGLVAVGDAVCLIDRPQSAWPISRLNRLVPLSSAPREILAELAGLPGLASAWRVEAAEAFARR